MGLLDNIFGSDSSSAVPGGNISKPLMIALMALLASRYFGGGSKDSAPAESRPAGDEFPDTISDGLGGLFKQFQESGLGDAVSSWIGTGSNKEVSPGEVEKALGPDLIDQLSKKTGIPKGQIEAALSSVLPAVVDRLTPKGRLPTAQEMAELDR